MIIYTTCRACGGLLHTTDGDTVHPLCEPKPTAVELLEQQFLAAAIAEDDILADALQYDLDTYRPPRLLDAALHYATWGWPVFPLKPQAKTPATRNGFKDATTDADQIRAWWTATPDANIGLPTGHAFDVIDFDIPDGIPTLHQILDEDRAVHGWVTTASAGTHLYITPTGRGNSARWRPGADFRGQGGYVVAPPSWLGRRGTSWTWRHMPSPAITGKGDSYGVAV